MSLPLYILDYLSLHSTKSYACKGKEIIRNTYGSVSGILRVSGDAPHDRGEDDALAPCSPRAWVGGHDD